MAMRCTVVALHIAGRDNSVADALSRVSIRVRGLGPYPDRELRWKFRCAAQRRRGAIDVDMLASDDGRNARAPNFRSPARSAFEGSLPTGRLWWFPRTEMVELVLCRIFSSLRESWRGAHLVLLPLLPWKPWYPKLSWLRREMEWGANVQLFADSSSGHRSWAPVGDDFPWAVFSSTKNA